MADRIVHTSKMAWVLDPKEPMAGWSPTAELL